MPSRLRYRTECIPFRTQFDNGPLIVIGHVVSRDIIDRQRGKTGQVARYNRSHDLHYPERPGLQTMKSYLSFAWTKWLCQNADSSFH